MSSFAEKKKAAQSAPRPFKDVTVTFDTGLGDARAEITGRLQDLLAERVKVLAPDDSRLAYMPDTTDIDAKIDAVRAELATVEEAMAETLVTLRFYKVPGDQWAEFTATNPARAGSLIDIRFGYNMHAVCKAAAIEHGRVIDGETELVQTEAEWAENWVLLGGAEFASVADAIYHLNEWEPSQRVERLKNFSEAATASAKK